MTKKRKQTNKIPKTEKFNTLNKYNTPLIIQNISCRR